MNFKRYELKYYLSEIQTESLAGRLQYLMSTDKYASPAGSYLVRSLYFDSIDDECLFQKQSGLLQRKKIRLRTYGTSGEEAVKFEIKHKHGQLVFKESVVVDRESASRICSGDHNLLLEYNNPVTDRIYCIFSTRAYSPKVIVEYTRQAFVFPAFNIRITFDTNLRSNINHLNLFSDVRDSMPVILEGKQILEVKYNHYLPGFIRQVLADVDTERMAISKYTLARRFHKKHKWEDN